MGPSISLAGERKAFWGPEPLPSGRKGRTEETHLPGPSSSRVGATIIPNKLQPPPARSDSEIPASGKSECNKS